MERADKEAWLEEAMEKWEVSLLRTCYAYLGDRALAEDAVQETFLKPGKDWIRSAARRRKRHG